jgi:diaminohydroxyphosphoribosylaminopyrimidine deaminase/5-amino-6-(5-phosphoribosylamino)uracil reductase
MTLDGRIATATGDSHWITGEESRAAAHLLRHEHDAILVGVGTVLADDPELTARGNSWYRQPLRVVADTRTSTPATAKLAGPNTLIATTMPDSPQAAALRDRGAEVVGVEGTDAGINLGALLRHLAERGILSVLVEGGAGIHGALFDARLVDAVVAFVAPKIVGGVGPAPVKGEGVDELADALNLEAIEVRRLGADIMISGECSRG